MRPLFVLNCCWSSGKFFNSHKKLAYKFLYISTPSKNDYGFEIRFFFTLCTIEGLIYIYYRMFNHSLKLQKLNTIIISSYSRNLMLLRKCFWLLLMLKTVVLLNISVCFVILWWIHSKNTHFWWNMDDSKC